MLLRRPCSVEGHYSARLHCYLNYSLLVCLLNFGAQTSSAAVDDPASVLVQLFEWSYPDIAVECETYLSQAGIAGVQISPPQEAIQGKVQTPQSVPGSLITCLVWGKLAANTPAVLCKAERRTLFLKLITPAATVFIWPLAINL